MYQLRKHEVITWDQVGGVNVDFERVSVCVGLHTSTLQCENINENGTHHATIWRISIFMEKFRVGLNPKRQKRDNNLYFRFLVFLTRHRNENTVLHLLVLFSLQAQNQNRQ